MGESWDQADLPSPVHIYVGTLISRALSKQVCSEDCGLTCSSSIASAALEVQDCFVERCCSDEEEPEDLVVFEIGDCDLDVGFGFENAAPQMEASKPSSKIVGQFQERATSVLKGGVAYVGNKWGTFGPMLNEKWSVVDAAAQQLEDVVKVKASDLSEKHRASSEAARTHNRQFNKWSMDFEAELAQTCTRVQRGLQTARGKVPVENMRQRFKSARGQMAGLSKGMWSASTTARRHSEPGMWSASTTARRHSEP